MNRQQQRQNARDQRRLQQKNKLRQQGARPSQPQLKPRPEKKSPFAVEPEKPSRLPRWWPWAAVAAVLVVVVVLLFALDPFGLRAPIQGVKLATQGNQHINPGDSHVAYNTDPPVSGPHFPTVPHRGTYTTPFVTEYLPHFLEHGGVEVLYNSSASPDVVKKLTDMVNSELDHQEADRGNVLLAPRPDMPCEVTLSSWQHIQVFNPTDCKQPGWTGHGFNPKSGKDTDLVKSFMERNQCAYDPENQCGDGAKGKTEFPTPVAGAPTVIATLGTATPVPGAPMNAPTPGTTPAPGPLAPAPATTPEPGPLAPATPAP
jgi:hypothetical protein